MNCTATANTLKKAETYSNETIMSLCFFECPCSHHHCLRKFGDDPLALQGGFAVLHHCRWSVAHLSNEEKEIFLCKRIRGTSLLSFQTKYFTRYLLEFKLLHTVPTKRTESGATKTGNHLQYIIGNSRVGEKIVCSTAFRKAYNISDHVMRRICRTVRGIQSPQAPFFTDRARAIDDTINSLANLAIKNDAPIRNADLLCMRVANGHKSQVVRLFNVQLI